MSRTGSFTLVTRWDGILAPHQVETLRLIKELRALVEQFGPEPIADTESYADDPTKNALEMARWHDLVVPWREKLQSNYALNFKDRAVKAYNQFVALGVQDRHLGVLASTASSTREIEELMQVLWHVAGRTN